MGSLLETKLIDGPDDRVVRLRFYDDDSMRIEIPDSGPMVISEAFLPGNDHTVVVKLDPRSKRRTTRASRTARPKPRTIAARKATRRRPTRAGSRSNSRSPARAR